MNPPASAGIEHCGHAALPSREGAQSRAATQGTELKGAEGREGPCKPIPESYGLAIGLGALRPSGEKPGRENKEREKGRGGGDLFLQGRAGCLCLSGPELSALLWSDALQREAK